MLVGQYPSSRHPRECGDPQYLELLDTLLRGYDEEGKGLPTSMLPQGKEMKSPDGARPVKPFAGRQSSTAPGAFLQSAMM